MKWLDVLPIELSDHIYSIIIKTIQNKWRKYYAPKYVAKNMRENLSCNLPSNIYTPDIARVLIFMEKKLSGKEYGWDIFLLKMEKILYDNSYNDVTTLIGSQSYLKINRCVTKLRKRFMFFNKDTEYSKIK